MVAELVDSSYWISTYTVTTNTDVPGMVTARNIFPPGESSGLPLIAARVTITESIRERLAKAQVTSIPIDDDLSDVAAVAGGGSVLLVSHELGAVADATRPPGLSTGLSGGEQQYLLGNYRMAPAAAKQRLHFRRICALPELISRLAGGNDAAALC